MITDRHRLADPIAAAECLSGNAAVLLRDYDAADRLEIAQTLRRVTRRRRLLFLVAGDMALADRVGADGLHLPEWAAGPAAGLAQAWKRRQPGRLLSIAAHSPAGLRRAIAFKADFALLAPVFVTASHPESRPIGALRFALWCRESPLAIYGLGGIDRRSAKRLGNSGAAGLAAIGAFAPLPARLQFDEGG